MGKPAETRISACITCIVAMAIAAVVVVAVLGPFRRPATHERVRVPAGRRGTVNPHAAKERPSERPDQDVEPAATSTHNTTGANATAWPRLTFSFFVSVTPPVEPQWQLDSLLMTTNPVSVMGNSLLPPPATECKAVLAYWSASAYPNPTGKGLSSLPMCGV